MKRRFIVTAFALAVVFGALLAWNVLRNQRRSEYVEEHRPGSKNVTVMTVKEQPWRAVVTAVGTLEAAEQIQVTTQVGGKVNEVLFDSGQEVEQGDLLVVLDDAVQGAQLAQALAQRDAARNTVQQYARLLEAGDISQQHYDTLELKYRQSRAQVALAQAAVQQLRISAPFSGRVSARQVRPGQVLEPGNSIATLDTQGGLYCDFSLPESDRSKVFVGQDVKLWTDTLPGQSVLGKVTALDPSVDPGRRHFGLRASFPNEDGKLAPGAFAKMHLLLAAEEEVLAIPRTAIVYTLQGDTVYVLDTGSQQERDGQQAFQVKRVAVTPGRERDEQVVIDTGLQAGQKIVTSGQLKLEDGEWVIPQPSEPPLD